MKLRKHNLVVSGLLFLVGVYVVLVALPAVTGTKLIGFLGDYAEGRFVILDVFKDSPADEVGLKKGNVILAQSGVEVGLWYRWFTIDLTKYSKQRARSGEQPHSYTVLSESRTQELAPVPRSLTGFEIVTHFGMRIFLIIFVAGLTTFIILSRTNERSAFLTCLAFCFAMLWFASDYPYWPRFYSPLFRDLGSARIGIQDLTEILSLQLLMGTLLHIALLFPRERGIVLKHNWFPLLSYPAALLPSATVLLIGDGGVLDRTSSAFHSREYVNTILLVLIVALMVDSYVRCDEKPVQKERARWIVTAMGIFSLGHLTFWNIPILLTGNPLVYNYNWLLLLIVLLPVTLTMAITHHQLFGTRGMIRGRIKLLEAMLRREKRLINTRDASIRSMQREIQQLREAIEQYDAMEDPEKTQTNKDMEKLEQQYPDLKDIRQNRLIGISPLWQNVFEQAVLAARGAGAVLLVGESGTGKTDVAWTIHHLSDRKTKIYKEISCAQFEHSDPAFALGKLFGIGTGHGLPNVAREGQKGLLEECNGGTLLMDDFDRLPLNVQDLFLYPLEGKPFDPGIGTGPSRSVSVKFIFASNREPERLAREGELRNDVLSRIVTRVDIPPLRQRKEDIPLLVERFVRQLSKDLEHDVPVISNKAMNLLSDYPYQRGNVRELKGELLKAISKASLEDDHVLRAGYLSEKMRLNQSGVKSVKPAQLVAPIATVLQDATELDVLRRHKFQIAPAETELGYSHKSKTLSNHLRGMCILALSESGWDAETAARALAGDNNLNEIPKLKVKMKRHLAKIEENARNRTADRLFNNLPVKYHEALTKAIEKVAAKSV